MSTLEELDAYELTRDGQRYEWVIRGTKFRTSFAGHGVAYFEQGEWVPFLAADKPGVVNVAALTNPERWDLIRNIDQIWGNL